MSVDDSDGRGLNLDVVNYLSELLATSSNGDKWASRPVIWIADDLPDWYHNMQDASDQNSAAQLHRPLQHCHQARATQLLGSSNQFIVYDASLYFNPNIFSSAIDSLLGGGIFVLLQNILAQAENSKPYTTFLQRQLTEFAKQYPQQYIPLNQAYINGFRSGEHRGTTRRDISMSDGRGVHAALEKASTTDLTLAPSFKQANGEQRFFVNDAIDLFNNTADKQCVLLQAKRGRGKSAALAWLAHAWLEPDSARKIILCAPSRKQVNTQMAIWSSHGPADLSHIQFFAVDDLLARLSSNEEGFLDRQNALVMIDEAAAISLSLLQQIASKNLNLVLATTTEGYEGCGRGFLLRYQQFLRNEYRHYHDFQLHQPIRWSQEDRLEDLVDELCGLRWQDPASIPDAAADVTSQSATAAVEINKLSARVLVDNPDLLRKVFRLLVDAHYQTRPLDLQRLLDDDSVHLWVAFNGEQVVGVLQTMEEGGFAARGDAELADLVASGHRRPAGNLVAQRLAFHFNDAHWSNLRSHRIMRIVTSDRHRRCGIASSLVQHFERWAREAQIDYWSSSFGYNDELMAFWSSQPAELVYLGSRVDKASGSFNAMVVTALGRQATQSLIDTSASQFRHEQNLLKQYLNKDSFEGVVPNESNSQLSPQELVRLQRFLDGRWDLDSALPLIFKCLAQFEPSQNSDISRSVQLLRDLSRFAPRWKKLADHYGLAGKTAFTQLIRTNLSETLLNSAK